MIYASLSNAGPTLDTFNRMLATATLDHPGKAYLFRIGKIEVG